MNEPESKEVIIDGEKAYPIYRISFIWIQDGDNTNGRHLDLPISRVYNSNVFYEMRKAEITDDELKTFVDELWVKYSTNAKFSESHTNVVLTKTESILHEYETWKLTWFTHETFDMGQTRSEVYDSFEKFVRRKENIINAHRFDESKPNYCLMGAEDRWRWGNNNKDIEPSDNIPCKCEHCKTAGMLRISH